MQGVDKHKTSWYMQLIWHTLKLKHWVQKGEKKKKNSKLGTIREDTGTTIHRVASRAEQSIEWQARWKDERNKRVLINIKSNKNLKLPIMPLKLCC